MAEYDLICDECGETTDPGTAVVSWASDDAGERGFALTHAHHVPKENTQRTDVRRLVWPNEYLRFATEMDSMRAASFGQRMGVKPGTTDGAVVTGAGTPAKTAEVEGGK